MIAIGHDVELEIHAGWSLARRQDAGGEDISCILRSSATDLVWRRRKETRWGRVVVRNERVAWRVRRGKPPDRKFDGSTDL